MKPIVVLQEPQNVINIAVVMRAMLNFGLRDLRLVAPAEFDGRRIEGIAHKSGELIERTEMFDTLDEALADCTFVAGLTARGRTAKRNVQRPNETLAELQTLSDADRPAFLFGREDKGLSNEQLDRCHRIVTIPTTENNSSLNLGQAATVMMAQWFDANETPQFKKPRKDAAPATRHQLELLFQDAERALDRIEFFKSRTHATIMRTIRELAHRMPLDEREAALVRATCLEVVNYLDRNGITEK